MIKINYLISLIFVLVLSFLLGYASFSGSSPEAYLFPKIITSVMISLSGLLLIFYFFDNKQTVKEINLSKLFIYLLLIIIFLFLGEILGFYFSTTLIFFSICHFYSQEKNNLKSLIYNVMISSGFMLSIYFLFSVLLKVQVPRFFLL